MIWGKKFRILCRLLFLKSQKLVVSIGGIRGILILRSSINMIFSWSAFSTIAI